MNKVNDKELGKRIKIAREKAKLSQHALYEKTGISTTQISAYENGKRNIGLQTIAKIALALHISIDELYYGSINSRPINTAINNGELIVNCVSALFEKNALGIIEKQDLNGYEPRNYFEIGFVEYSDILDDMIHKLDDFEKNKENYPDPEGFKKQILASATKQINDRILK